MRLIAYISTLVETSQPIDDVLNDIVKSSKRNNAELKVTGILFLMDGRFLQILEGEDEAVRGLIDKIKSDSRHTNFEVLIDTDVVMRGFDNWHMDVMHLKAGKQYSRHYIKSITSAFENMMVPKSDTLADYYTSILAEKEQSRFCLWAYVKAFFTRRRPVC